MATATMPDAPPRAAPAAAGPILIDLDDALWEKQLDRAASWFGNVLLAQAAYRKMAEDTAASLNEPHIKKYIGDIATKAKEHEGVAADLFRAIGRDPARGRVAGGVVHAKLQEAAGAVMGWVGGGTGGWLLVRQLVFANADAMGGFAVAEQLGYMMGLPEVVDRAFPVVNELSTQRLVIMEFMLELAPASILMGDKT